MSVVDNRSHRHIIHLDMDAFFAAVEQRDRPELRGKPVLVGGDPKGRGVVSTASYEARQFGCHSAMPMAQAIRLCPKAIIVRPRMDRYAEVSKQILAILDQFTPLVEPLSIDEGFLDVTGSTRLLGSPETIGADLKHRVRAATNLTASVGVGPNKFVAKLASSSQKPDGLVVVAPGDVRDFLEPLPITRLWGVGKATLPRLEKLGIRTFGDALRFSKVDWRREFGEHGAHFYELVRGIDERRVVPDREAKSISQEVTFAVDIVDLDFLRLVILDQMDHVAYRLRRHRLTARNAMLKIRSADFTTITRRATLHDPTDETERLWQLVSELFDAWRRLGPPPVRLIGVGVSQFSTDETRQLDLFGASARCNQSLDQAVDTIRDRFGNDAIRRGGQTRAAEHGGA